MTAGLFALAGVALGALLNWWAARSSREAERKERRRRELLDLTAEFLSNVDALWRGAIRLNNAVVGMMHSRSDDGDVHQHYADERLAAFDDMYSPRREAELAIMQFKILAPSLTDLATKLRDASAAYDMDKHAEKLKHRDAAADAFIAAVQELVEGRGLR